MIIGMRCTMLRVCKIIAKVKKENPRKMIRFSIVRGRISFCICRGDFIELAPRYSVEAPRQWTVPHFNRTRPHPRASYTSRGFKLPHFHPGIGRNPSWDTENKTPGLPSTLLKVQSKRRLRIQRVLTRAYLRRPHTFPPIRNATSFDPPIHLTRPALHPTLRRTGRDMPCPGALLLATTPVPQSSSASHRRRKTTPSLQQLMATAALALILRPALATQAGIRRGGSSALAAALQGRRTGAGAGAAAFVPSVSCRQYRLTPRCEAPRSPVPIPHDRLEFSFSRSSGPGGQNVNKVSRNRESRRLGIVCIVQTY